MIASNIYLSIIVPAFNEAARIGGTLQRIREHLSLASFTYEIVVVLDGSQDNTREAVERFLCDR